MKVSNAIRKVKDYIISSEMGGEIDKEDPYYPTLIGLDDLLVKTEEEER